MEKVCSVIINQKIIKNTCVFLETFFSIDLDHCKTQKKVPPLSSKFLNFIFLYKSEFFSFDALSVSHKKIKKSILMIFDFLKPKLFLVYLNQKFLIFENIKNNSGKSRIYTCVKIASKLAELR